MILGDRCRLPHRCGARHGGTEAERGPLLRHYLEWLPAHAVEPPTWAEAETAYRHHLAYGLYLWAMTQFVEEPITTQFVRRLGHVVADDESLELLGM